MSQQLFGALLVGRQKIFVDVWCNLHEHFRKNTTNLDYKKMNGIGRCPTSVLSSKENQQALS
jgi:hypothetical protein